MSFYLFAFELIDLDMDHHSCSLDPSRTCNPPIWSQNRILESARLTIPSVGSACEVHKRVRLELELHQFLLFVHAILFQESRRIIDVNHQPNWTSSQELERSVKTGPSMSGLPIYHPSPRRRPEFNPMDRKSFRYTRHLSSNFDFENRPRKGKNN